MFDGPFQAEEVHICRVQHDVEEEATDDHVPRIAQGDDDLQFGKHPQPDVERHGGRGILVQQQAGGRFPRQLAQETLHIAPAHLRAPRGGQRVQDVQRHRAGRRGKVEAAGDFLGEGHRLVEREHVGVSVQDLFNQRGAAARMAAKEGKLKTLRRGGLLPAPAPDHFRCETGQQGAALPVPFVIAPFEQRCVRDGADLGLGLQEPAHGLRVLAELVQHHAEQVPAGVFDVRIARPVLDQIPQFGFRFGELLSAMQQESVEIAGLVVPGMERKTRLHTLPSLVQTAFLLKPDGQVHAGVHHVRRGGDGALIAGAGVVQLPESLVLLADHAQEGGVARSQFKRAAVGLVGLGKIQFARGGIAQLEPQLGDGGIADGQLPVGLKSRRELPAEQLLLRVLPARDIARRALQLSHAARHDGNSRKGHPAPRPGCLNIFAGLCPKLDGGSNV